MAGPKRQHFIPKSYLRNFAVSPDNDDKAFVEVMNVKTGEIIFPFSISNVCVSKNIYTIPNAKEGDKYALENYYAQNVDGVYPEVYRMLIDPDKIELTEAEREKILSTTLSLYFRTSKFLDAKNKELEGAYEYMDRAQEKFGDEEGELNMYVGDRNYHFKMSSLEETKQQMKMDYKMDFIIGHFQNWQNFVRHKYNSQITVLKVTNEFPLITSDNPVDIYNHKKTSLDIFDPNVSIQLPLDREHFLWISPNTQNSERNIIYRGVRDKWFAFTSNKSAEASATEWIIGNENTLAAHLEQHKTYTVDNPDGEEIIDSIETRKNLLAEFVEIAQKNGMSSDVSINKFKELQQNKYLQEDPMFVEMGKQMKEKGFI